MVLESEMSSSVEEEMLFFCQCVIIHTVMVPGAIGTQTAIINSFVKVLYDGGQISI